MQKPFRRVTSVNTAAGRTIVDRLSVWLVEARPTSAESQRNETASRRIDYQISKRIHEYINTQCTFEELYRGSECDLQMTAVNCS